MSLVSPKCLEGALTNRQRALGPPVNEASLQINNDDRRAWSNGGRRTCAGCAGCVSSNAGTEPRKEKRNSSRPRYPTADSVDAHYLPGCAWISPAKSTMLLRSDPVRWKTTAYGREATGERKELEKFGAPIVFLLFTFDPISRRTHASPQLSTPSHLSAGLDPASRHRDI